MPSSSQQTTAASNKAQTSAALSAVPLSAWLDYTAQTDRTKAQFSNGFTLPTEEHLRVILAKQNRDRSNGIEPSQFMYKPADNCTTWRRPPLEWDFPVLKPVFELKTGYPISGVKLDRSHDGHFLNATPLSEDIPAPNDQVLLADEREFAKSASEYPGSARLSNGYQYPYPKDPETQVPYARKPEQPQFPEARDRAMTVRSASPASSYDSCHSR